LKFVRYCFEYPAIIFAISPTASISSAHVSLISFCINIDTISNNNDVSYKIRLDSKKNNYLSDESKELSLSVKDYFPNEELMVVYST